MSQDRIIKALEKHKGKELTVHDLRVEVPEVSLNTMRRNLERLRKFDEVEHRQGKQNVIFYRCKE